MKCATSRLQDVDEARRVLQHVVGDGLQLGNDLLLAGRLEPRRVALGEEEVADELLVLEAVEQTGVSCPSEPSPDADADERPFPSCHPSVRTPTSTITSSSVSVCLMPRSFGCNSSCIDRL